MCETPDCLTEQRHLHSWCRLEFHSSLVSVGAYLPPQGFQRQSKADNGPALSWSQAGELQRCLPACTNLGATPQRHGKDTALLPTSANGNLPHQ